MLSISKPIIGAGQGEYYLNLAATDDYYLSQEGEPPGFWLGEGAKILGLEGLLEPNAFRQLLRGMSPDGTKPLVHNAQSEKRRAGWDLSWSVPKSVSVIWSQADPVTRGGIEECVRNAVRAGIDYLESLGVVSRCGENGVLREPCRMIFAAFEHSTSRAQDPQLHIHTILLNIGVRANNSTGALEPRLLFRHQLAAGAIFRAELAAQLESTLGLRARREGWAFELMGVLKDLIVYFSKRRAEIEAELRRTGATGGKAPEKAALRTRSRKETISRERLFAEWQLVGRLHNWTGNDIFWLRRVAHPTRNREFEIQSTATNAVSTLTHQQSTFSRRELLQAVAEEAQGRGLGAREVRTIAAGLWCSEELIPLAEHRGEMQATTREVLALEHRVLSAAKEMQQGAAPYVEGLAFIDQALAKHPQLTQEQQAALRHLCHARGGLCLVQGMAGTGKSTLLGVAREIWQEQGFDVVGAALAGKAAKGLMDSTGIPSHTLHRRLWLMERGPGLGTNSVLVIDEAAMVGTRQLVQVFDACWQAGAKLVLCGDSRQVQPVELGGIFTELTRRYACSELKEIRRQRDGLARTAVRDMAAGRADLAMRSFDQRGLVTMGADAWAAIDHLVKSWAANPVPSAILAGTVAEVSALNQRAQEARREAGSLGALQLSLDGQNFHAGDRILFTRNSITLGVMNGDTGTVQRVEPPTMAVVLDNGHTVAVDTRTYHHLALGYALTTHKAQGITVETAFVLAGGPMTNREIAYVQASRARGTTHWYLTDELPPVIERMKSSREKLAAITLAPPPSLELVLTP